MRTTRGVKAWMRRVGAAGAMLAGSLAMVASAALGASARAADGREPSFRNDVLPILSKAGCNGGGCHGALAGKGGFRLSLFAYNPEADHLAITRESQGRRIEVGAPGLSLLLTKPTGAVPHQGGRRIEPGSEDYQTLARWIAAGAPGPGTRDRKVVRLVVEPAEQEVAPGQKVAVRVTAVHDDGSRRDVTRWMRFASTDETVASVDGQGTVTVLGPGLGAVTAWYASQIVVARVVAPHPHAVDEAAWKALDGTNRIDQLVQAQLRRLRLAPSPRADDATWLRRMMLDTAGRLPTPVEVRGFVGDADPGKHGRWVDRMLASEEFVDAWTYRWSDVLLVTGAKLRPASVKAYHGWIRERVATNAPWDRMVRELVTSRGSSLEDGASNFYAIHQDPESMAENVSQAFLGLSINCARCHNHPLEKWTNDEYYRFANLFARVRAKGWGGDARNGDGKRTVYVEARGDLIQPPAGKPQPPAPLDGAALDPADPRDRREVLADWLTSPSNPYFSRAISNRVWAAYMGVGLVEPVDDLRVSNPASNEALLSELASFLVSSRYDLRALMRWILTSETYARSGEPLEANRDDRRHYSRHFARRLPAEVLSDAIAAVTGVPDRYTELALSDGSTEATTQFTNVTRSLQLADASVKSYFLRTFGRNQREITCECERSNQPSLVQVLHLSNGNTVNGKLASPEGRLARMLSEIADDGRLVEEAYLLCLSRPPRPAEKAALAAQLAAAGTSGRNEVAEDLLWSLLTSREFLFQH